VVERELLVSVWKLVVVELTVVGWVEVRVVVPAVTVDCSVVVVGTVVVADVLARLVKVVVRVVLPV